MEIETVVGRSDSPPFLQHTNYREFLRAVFDAKRQVNARFSFRGFSKLVGFKSPNYLQMILDGQRNLTLITARTIATALKLKVNETAYFLALVKKSNAVTESERNQAERERLAAIKRIVSREIPAAKREIFSRWYHLLIRELFLLPNAKMDPAWIEKMLAGMVTLTEAEHSLAILIQTGFLSREGKVLEPVLDTDDTKMQAAFMRDFHAQTLRAWSLNLAQLGPVAQELGVLNIPIHTSKIPQLRAKIRQFQEEIIGLVQDETEANRVVQLGTYLIPFPEE